MSGKWTKIVPPPHECQKPICIVTITTGPGSEWTCDCGKKWVLVGDSTWSCVSDWVSYEQVTEYRARGQ